MGEEAVSLLIYTMICCIGSLLCYMVYKDYFHPGIMLTWVYYYATAGNVILYVLGFEINLGIKTYYIADAMMVSSLAIISFICPSLIIRKTSIGKTSIFIPEHITPRVYQVLGLLATVMTVLVLAGFSSIASLYLSSGLPKSQILAALPRWYVSLHYVYMLFWMIFFAMLLSISGLSFFRRYRLLLSNFLVFIGYSIITRERDFVLLLIPIFLIINRTKKIGAFKMVTYMLIVLVAVAGLYTLKYDEVRISSLELILNQGTTLLIMTNVMSWIDDGLEFKYGKTYLNSLINLLPSFIHREGVPLIYWFKDNYNPSSAVGYGFSLEAEGYLNFGEFGVVVIFFILGLLFQICYLNFNNNVLIWNFVYLFLTPYFIYSIRGDSLMLLKGLTYSCFLFFILLIGAQGFKLYTKRHSVG